jgi:hypothetical protein
LKLCDESELELVTLLDVSAKRFLGTDVRNLFFFEYLNKVIIKYKGSILLTDKLREIIYLNKSVLSVGINAMTNDDIHVYQKLFDFVEPKVPDIKNKWMFASTFFQSVELDQYNDDYGKRIDVENQMRISALKEFGDATDIFRFSNHVGSPATVGSSYAFFAKDEAIEMVLSALQEGKVKEEFARSFFNRLAIIKGNNFMLAKLKSLSVKYKDAIAIPLSSLCPSKEVWNFVESLDLGIQKSFWEKTSVNINNKINDAIFVISKFNSVNRFYDSFMIIYAFRSSNDFPTIHIVNTFKLFINYANMQSVIDKFGYGLTDLILDLDKRNDVDEDTLIQIEFLFYRLIKSHGKSNQLRLINDILTKPAILDELISLIYLSDDKEEKNKEIEALTLHPERQYTSMQCYNILDDINRCPFENEKYEIDEKKLIEFITQSRLLANCHHRMSKMDVEIGKLLANCHFDDKYPNEVVCRIIEKLDNNLVNSGFSSRTFNRLGMTVRSPFSGGNIEHAESKKYKKIADKLRLKYVVITKIFDDLSCEYDALAKVNDVQSQIESFDY